MGYAAAAVVRILARQSWLQAARRLLDERDLHAMQLAGGRVHAQDSTVCRPLQMVGVAHDLLLWLLLWLLLCRPPGRPPMGHRSDMMYMQSAMLEHEYWMVPVAPAAFLHFSFFRSFQVPTEPLNKALDMEVDVKAIVDILNRIDPVTLLPKEA